MNIEQIFKAIGKKITIDFEEITSQIEHRQSKGHVRETKIVECFLRKYLPNTVGIAVRGEVVSTDGQTSQECDIILYEQRSCPPFIRESDYSVFPIELVHGIIEVKSKLDKHALEDAFKKIIKLKRMPKRAFLRDNIILTPLWYDQSWEYFPLAGFVFGYDSIDLDTLRSFDSLQRNLPLAERVDSVWVLKKGMIVNRGKSGRGIYPTPSNNSCLAAARSDNPLLSIVTLLQQHFQVPLPRRFNISEYLKYADMGYFLDKK